MGMSSDLKQKVKENFDYDFDGSLKAIAKKASVLDAPILIIGLGGTGVDAVLKVKRMIYDRIQCFAPGGKWKDKPENIEYLVMDTDISNRNRSIQGIGFNEAMEEVFIFTNPKMSVILDNKERFLTKEIRSWISDKLKMDTVIDGAGGVRQIGRLMMSLNINQMVSAIESKIKRVAMRYPNNIPIYVFILSGICGGTGSGTFLDIPYIIRGIVDKPEIGRIVNNIGLIFLPDVNLEKPGISETKRLSLKRNGFAALKELDYLMNLENTGEKFEQLYGNLNVRTSMKPYDVCVLMSAKDNSGKIDPNSYNYTINVSAEIVVNFVASEEVKKGGDFTINSFLSNIRDDNITFLHNILGKNRRPLNYCYSIAGASSASLPVDELISYITYLAFKEVDTMYNRQTSENDVLEVIRWFGLEDNTIGMRFLMDMPNRENMQRHSYEKIKMNTAVVLADFDDTLARQKAFVDRRCDELTTELQKKIDDSNNILMNIFRDVNKGPVYANQLLFTLTDNLSITRYLLEQRDRFINKKPTGIQLNALKSASSNAADSIFNKGMFDSKKKLRDEFIESFSNYYDTQMNEYLFHKLSILAGVYHDKFLTMNNTVYDCVADLLNTLVPLFKKYGSIKTEAKETKSSTLTIMSWSLIEAPEFIKEIEQHLKEGDQLYINLKQFVASFYSRLYENANVWSGKEKVDGIELINRFISESFTTALDQSMDYYLELFASKEGKALDMFCFDVLNRLNEKAKIMFPIQQAMKGLGITFPRFSSYLRILRYSKR
ncbi:MAG: tubulin-like doman-containing protein [Mobilitalea sp.]